MKNLIKIINEEVSGFDFLGNDEILKHQEYINLLNNEDFQKQFICDFLLDKKDKYKIIETITANIGGDWENNRYDDINKLTIEYDVVVEFTYDKLKKPVKFSLYFASDNIHVDVVGYEEGDNINQEYLSDYSFNDIQWGDIEVKLFSIDGEEIKFQAFDKAPSKIQNLFIREFTVNLISTETNIDVTDKVLSNNVKNTPYC